MKKINLISLGCAKNLVDSQIIKGNISKSGGKGFSFTENSDDADIILINTCGFIQSAKEESIDTIFNAVKMKKDSEKKVVVSGCFSERYKDEIKNEIPEIDGLFGVGEFQNVAKFITGKTSNAEDLYQIREISKKPYTEYLKIAEGCSSACSFCSIPLMRGLQNSRSMDSIMKEAHNLKEKGVKELLIISQNTTTFGWEKNEKDSLADLIREIDGVGFDWVRMMYTHPANFRDSYIDALSKAPSFVPYIDMPVQHVSNDVLKSMRRGITSRRTKEIIKNLRDRIPNLALRTSIIIGYPNETERDFENLLEFVDETKFDRLGVFTYSHEEDTTAFLELKDTISKKEKQKRADAVMDLQRHISFEKNQSLINSTQRILIDEVNEKENYSTGRTIHDAPEIDNEVIIHETLKVGEFFNVRITDALEYDLIGETI
jgi:ribosomal protein S12 methylthiotransferase